MERLCLTVLVVVWRQSKNYFVVVFYIIGLQERQRQRQRERDLTIRRCTDVYSCEVCGKYLYHHFCYPIPSHPSFLCLLLFLGKALKAFEFKDRRTKIATLLVIIICLYLCACFCGRGNYSCYEWTNTKKHIPCTWVPTGLTSRGGDVAVSVFDMSQPRLPTPFHSDLVSVSVFIALSTVFRPINSPDNYLCFLTLFFRSCFCLIGPFNYIYLYESVPQP